MKKAFWLLITIVVVVPLCVAAWSRSFEPQHSVREIAPDLMSSCELSQEQADAAVALFEELGLGSATFKDGFPNGDLAMAFLMDGLHQVNVTFEHGGPYVVAITGFYEDEYVYRPNWRGKLRLTVEEKKVSFDLYDSSVEGGYLAWYDEKNDEVVPWDER